MPSRIININDLEEHREFVLGYGHFTTIHPGHIRYLKYAKSLGSELIIAIKDDGIYDDNQLNYQ